MRKFLQDYSLHEIEQLAVNNPVCRDMFQRLLASSYQDFVEVLYADLDLAVNRLEGNPQLYQNDSEDELTGHIIGILQTLGYAASHGTTGGGSKDITVNGKNPSWVWIGEAKIYKSSNDLHEGYLQLSTRYRHPDPTKSCGGLLAYIKRPNAATLMDKWKVEFMKLPLPNLNSRECPKRSKLAFFSIHDHESSGLPFEVRHLAVCLHFYPRDKSGRKAKRYARRGSELE